MADEPQNPGPFFGGQPAQPAGDQGTFSQKFSHNPVAARVPERVARGVFSTGVCVQEGVGEFVLDFLQALSRPPAIVARVVLAPGVMLGLVNSLRENLNRYTQTFGPPAPLPKPPTAHTPSIQEIYEHFKLPEELYSGSYANSFIIAHGPAEFVIDFITGFYPTAAVSCRTYVSAQQIPRVLDTLGKSFQQHQARLQALTQQPPPPPPPQAM